MKRKAPFWSKSHANHWVCPDHIPPTRIPLALEYCWYCNAARPLSIKIAVPTKIKLVPIIVKVYAEYLCGWEHCSTGENSERSFALLKRKYCSHECRKKRARNTYKMKKLRQRAKAKKESMKKSA